MSEPEYEIVVPPGFEGGVVANHIDVFEDVEYTTIDFAFLDPRDTRVGSVVARVTVPASCILELKERIERL